MQKIKNDIITTEGSQDGGDLLPSQFFSGGDLGSNMEAERSLMAAVLIDALRIFEKGVRSHRTRLKRFREVEEWFMEDDTEWPYSFQNICSELGLNPETIRDVLQKVRSEEMKPIFWRKRLKIGGGSPVKSVEEDSVQESNEEDKDDERDLREDKRSKVGKGTSIGESRPHAN